MSSFRDQQPNGDPAETLHRSIYGKSGRASANAGNAEFLAGYDLGRTVEVSGEVRDLFDDEYERRGSPVYGKPLRDFKEWKRGVWAAALQRAFAEVGRFE